MELFISEAEIEDASMIIDYLNQVGGESDNLTYGLNECYLNEFEEMEVIQDFIDQENSLLLCGFIDDELVSLLSIQGEHGTSEKKTETDGEPIHLSPSKEVEDYWTGFLKNLEISDESNVKSERLVCRLDRDLADSLDDCNIHNRSRSDMVNAIVRTFFDIYLLQLVPFRREKKSLFTNFNQKDYEKEKD